MSQGGSDTGLSLKTLVISSAAAVVAAVVVPMFWEKGTLIATALTPIVVALASDLLSRPIDRVATVSARRRQPGEAAGPSPGVRRHLFRRRFSRRHVGIAVATGALAFVVAAAFVTLSDVIAGESVSRGGDRTTLWGGDASPPRRTEEPTPPAATPTPEPGATPTVTPTPTPTATPTTTQEQPPTETAPGEPEPEPEPSATPTPSPLP